MASPSSSSHALEKTFAELYCEASDIKPEAFEDSVLREALHPPARLLWPLIRRLDGGGLFTPDRELARALGRLRDLGDFPELVREYRARNHGFLRGALQFRLSIRLLGKLMERTLHVKVVKVVATARFEPVSENSLPAALVNYVVDPFALRVSQCSRSVLGNSAPRAAPPARPLPCSAPQGLANSQFVPIFKILEDGSHVTVAYVLRPPAHPHETPGAGSLPHPFPKPDAFPRRAGDTCNATKPTPTVQST